jgi:hypothetical protein
MLDLLAHLPHILPTLPVSNVAGQVPRQHVLPALLIIVLAWKVRKRLFPAFHIRDITREMIGFISPTVQIILFAVKL